LVFGVNKRLAGALANYPTSHFDTDMAGPPIHTRDDLFEKTDPFPSGFPGPNNGLYPFATAPDRLRSIWGVEGLAARDMKQARQSSYNTRPALSALPKRQNIQTSKPWARAQQYINAM